MHIGIILKLTRHEPIRNSWNVIRILNVAQMSYQIEAPIGNVSFWKSRIIHQNFHRFSLKSKPKNWVFRCFSQQKIGLKAWNFGFVSCNKTSPQIGSVHQNVRTCQPSAWGLGALRGVFLVPLFALDFLGWLKTEFRGSKRSQ